MDKGLKQILNLFQIRLCIKVGRGPRDACVGTWDLGTRDEGLGDVKYGTRRRQKLGRREPGMLMIIAKVGGKCDISFLVEMCYLWSTLALQAAGSIFGGLRRSASQSSHISEGRGAKSIVLHQGLYYIKRP